MDKYLLLIGLQLTQTAALGAIDGSLWQLLRDGAWLRHLAELDAATLGSVLETVASGTWIGRIAGIGETAVVLAQGLSGLPLALIVAQWLVVIGFLCLERRVLRRRLAQIG